MKIDGRKRFRLREEKGWEGEKKQRQLGRGTDEYLEEKTPIERMQMRRTTRMDTRLRTPTPR